MLHKILATLIDKTCFVHLRETLTQHTQMGPITQEFVYLAKIRRVLPGPLSWFCEAVLQGKSATAYVRQSVFQMTDKGPITTFRDRDIKIDGAFGRAGVVAFSGSVMDASKVEHSIRGWMRAEDVLMVACSERACPDSTADATDAIDDSRVILEVTTARQKGSGDSWLYVPVNEISTIVEVSELAMASGTREVKHPFEVLEGGKKTGNRIVTP